MIDQFESNPDVKFTTLSNIPITELKSGVTASRNDLQMPNTHNKSNENVTVATSKDDNGNITSTEVLNIKELSYTDETAKDERVQRELKPDQILFMAIGFVFIPILQFVKLCPEVIWCDITSYSNNKGFHLLTFSCRNTAIGKQTVFMYLWLPNQKRSSFRWVFMYAVTVLLPKHVRERVKMIMKDGDPQQRNEILISILLNVFPNAIEASCGWHIGKPSCFLVFISGPLKLIYF